MTIQWFPGHMAKARREVTEKLKLIDVVIELLDARVPLSSRNPMMDEIVAHKPRLVLLNKDDLADPSKTKEWTRFFEEGGATVLPINAQTGQGVSRISPACQTLAQALIEKQRAKGMKPRAIRAMILGIPNVGKSTLINRLASKRIAKVGDRPGITKQQQWIKVGKELELLDTPGILWPKFDDQATGFRLAATGAIKDELLDFQDVALFVLRYMREMYPDRLMDRYKLNELPEDGVTLFDAIGKKRGHLLSGGYIDYDKTAEMILRELRAGTLGRITLEVPGKTV
ncbi:ribosome biogenesis GTPase YlqF [Halalkalibacterium halodurans]|jgi:ribosome biogenesis GTPase A|uniref:Ribosome biogenesis GTPase A n=2 Tax=Halalkalibacterium halodurans TaxID=86665 RepID=Q7AJT8_HALH5|nr:ribosome biogenesis GTPase YlqF [Halalkalibacterium halodurans]MDY7223023.1 ribosome biogenesis GTPase YlqF [Halalkalibacterium halodurans]MDY7242244.1 ribosome biogenesis GTPase YlqF [Halalkalibacterium halodurans]MED4081528.1 ribosome biogenesis GTPase YlqF [Halalkalibacterium halodurans]MED4086144.1 ribosome biogenesis GTPase YlqF [Halalkalibacterium halodurans]MED4106214.1 ribosome biogenesis GTPase YlqF [Halalkalibacterium halodurans]